MLIQIKNNTKEKTPAKKREAKAVVKSKAKDQPAKGKKEETGANG
jgi:hypothetical protein